MNQKKQWAATLKQDKVVFVLLVALIVVSRWIPHPHNFTALTAVTLFAGSFWSNKHWRFAVPLAALFISDLFFGFYPGIEMNYIAAALCVFLSPDLKSKSWMPVVVSSTLASVVFFVVSNLGVWFFADLYPMTLSGLQTCFVMAIPFYSSLLASSLVYSFVLYGGYRLFSLDRVEDVQRLKHG